MYLRTKDGRVDDVQLKIFEPPRFFESFMCGRPFREAPEPIHELFLIAVGPPRQEARVTVRRRRY